MLDPVTRLGLEKPFGKQRALRFAKTNAKVRRFGARYRKRDEITVFTSLD